MQSDTISGSGDVGVCLGGEADTDVPAIPTTTSSPLLIINSWNCRPQLPAEVVVAAENVPVVVAPDMPSELQVVAFHVFVGPNLAALVQKSLHR